MTRLYALLLHWLCRLGAPFGGVRPRRIYHWLARRAYPPGRVSEAEFRWYRDRWGHRFYLHPYFHIDREIIAFGSYDRPLMEFLHGRIKPGMVCFDIGANMGIVTVHLAGLVGPRGRIHAFEPVPHVRSRLERHVQENGFDGIVRIHPLALSDRSGTASLSIADPWLEDNQGMATLVNPDHPKLSRRIDVETRTLDELVAGLGLERLDWMKVDIQGAEPLLLAGGEATLRRFGPSLLMEVAPSDLAGMGRTSPDLLRLLEQREYRTFELRDGGVGPELHADRVAADYRAENILAVRRDRL